MVNDKGKHGEIGVCVKVQESWKLCIFSGIISKAFVIGSYQTVGGVSKVQLVVQQELHVGLRNKSAVVLPCSSSAVILACWLIKGTMAVACFDQLGSHCLSELRVALGSEESSLDIHALDTTIRSRSQDLDFLWWVIDMVFVHLVKAQSILSKEFLSCIGKLGGNNRHFPSNGVSTNLGTN